EWVYSVRLTSNRYSYLSGRLMATGLPVAARCSCWAFSVAMSLICLVIATDWNVSALESCFRSSWIFAALSSPITISTFRLRFHSGSELIFGNCRRLFLGHQCENFTTAQTDHK